MSRLPAAALLAVALSACNAHVALPPAPPPTAPIQHRVGYYQRYRPANNRAAFNPFGYSPYGAWSSLPANNYLVLADGTIVYDPTDLIPMVGDDSPLAESARRAERAQRLASAFTWGGVAASVVGAILMLTSFDSTSYDGSLPTSFWAGLGLGIAGSVSTSVGRLGFSTAAATERAGAFNSLDAAIRSRMALCNDGDVLRDCNAPPAAPAPPPAAAPPLTSPWAAPPPLTPAAPSLAPGVSIHQR